MGAMQRVFRGVWLGCGVLLGLLAIAPPALAQDFGLVKSLPNPNENKFGGGVAFSGGTLFLAAQSVQGANEFSGLVRVVSEADWSEVAQLKSSVDADYNFGALIELDGERALISNAAIDRGVVWFFEKVNGVWTEKHRVQGLLDEAFGYRLALRGDFAFVSAPRVGTGNVHVYQRVQGTWGEVQLLTASDALSGDFFGYSLAFDGQRLAVGAPGNFLGPARTAVYTFSRVGDAFVEDGKLAGNDPTSRWFGAEVGLNGDTLIVNAPPVYQGTTAGHALVYERRDDQWAPSAELAVEGEAKFPEGLAMDHDRAWIGAGAVGPSALNVYGFKRTGGGWQRVQTLNFPVLAEYGIATWDYRDQTFVIGFWDGVGTESIQVFRASDYQGSSGGVSSGGNSGAPSGGSSAESSSGSSGAAEAGGLGTAGSTNSGGTSGESSAATGASSGRTEPSSGASAGQGSNAASADSSGCQCTLALNHRAGAWPLAALGLAMALIRRRRALRVPAN